MYIIIEYNPSSRVSAIYFSEEHFLKDLGSHELPISVPFTENVHLNFRQTIVIYLDSQKIDTVEDPSNTAVNGPGAL